jgi:ABC-type multidrug transport system ATPase subunit
VFDRPYAALPRAALRIGAVLEATDFHPGRSGRDHLRMLGQAVDVPDSRADEVLRLVELGDAARRRVKGYSLGMRQRLGLAAALLGHPELLILDEPANGLDPEGVRWLRDFLHSLASEGRTVLISRRSWHAPRDGDGLEELPDRGGIGPVAGIVGDRSALVKSRVWRSRRSGSISLLVMWMLVLM